VEAGAFLMGGLDQGAPAPGVNGLAEHPGFRVAARCDELALRLDRTLSDRQDELIARMAAAGDERGSSTRTIEALVSLASRTRQP
jgi:hypothetical protein